MEILEEYGIIPNDPNLFEIAFVHKSYRVQYGLDYDYERLEFLGDSILSMLISEYLYKKYEDIGEGSLTKLRSNYVCETALANYSHELGLANYVKLHLDDSRVSANEVLSVNADVFESFLGAIYLDQGIDKSREFLSKIVFPSIDGKVIFFNDYKSQIKEYGDANEIPVQYKLIKEYGVPHDKTFLMKILVDNREVGRGKGKSKKEAEQLAAEEAIKKLGI
ncbi:ribonuclease 3 [Methanobrevibacter cuticularis]|uniref:ribonuclease III n=1 Tax=Methanobrevibacter cuticularis TaxID=47311 RepID=A0A166CQ14_9EURY|nr:ribonuclease III [Methanobrevibacter cuticularis]KZX15947.1 ribonuclease 3 [Methanobrevibacter cuticularis]